MTPAMDARRARRVLAAAAAISLLVAACGSTASPSPSASGSPAPASAPPSASGAPTASATPGPTGAPTATATGSPSATPRTTATPGGVAACTGSADNRAFFAGVAADVTWDVYCPVLPAGWYVDTGSFRLAGGGRMEISYKGPAGQRIAIRQGYYCAGQSDCIPSGPDVGTASYGDRPARLVDLGGGSWLVVAQEDELSWEARGSGMDSATLAGYTAAFVRVGS